MKKNEKLSKKMKNKEKIFYLFWDAGGSSMEPMDGKYSSSFGLAGPLGFCSHFVIRTFA
jgi:hypothetical protein